MKIQRADNKQEEEGRRRRTLWQTKGTRRNRRGRTGRR
jgi:hypothetical protein